MDTENRYYQIFRSYSISYHKVHKSDHAKWRSENLDAIEIDEPVYKEALGAYFDLLKQKSPDISVGPASKI